MNLYGLTLFYSLMGQLVTFKLMVLKLFKNRITSYRIIMSKWRNTTMEVKIEIFKILAKIIWRGSGFRKF